MMIRMGRFLGVLAFCLLGFISPWGAARVAYASSGYPLNGTLNGGVGHWFLSGTVAWSSAGRTAGTLKFVADCGDNVGCGAYSQPFTVGTSATLGFYSGGTSSTRHIYKIDVINYSAAAYTNGLCVFDTTETGWNYHSCSLAAYAGKVVSIGVRDAYNGGINGDYMTDFDIDYASAAPPAGPPFINGAFNTSLVRWSPVSHIGDWYYTNAIGHNQLGAAKWFGNGAWAYAYSYPLTLDSNTWSMCYAGDSGQTAVKIDIGFVDWTDNASSGYVGFNDTSVAYDFHGPWVCFGIDPSLWAGHVVTWRIGLYSTVNSYVYTDDWCPYGGCLSGTAPGPTSTPGPSSTPPAVNATIVFPTPPPYFTQVPYPTPPPYFTQVPFPTFPPYPSQIPYPTIDPGFFPTQIPPLTIPIPLPVTFDGTPQPVYLTTPIIFPTPLNTWTPGPTRLATWTAVPSPTLTPSVTPYASPLPVITTIAEAFPTISYDPADHTLAFVASGSTDNPFGLDIQQAVIDHFPLNVNAIFWPGSVGSLTLTIHMIYVNGMKFAGIDLLPGIKGLAAAFIFVFLIRSLQAR